MESRCESDEATRCEDESRGMRVEEGSDKSEEEECACSEDRGGRMIY